jgi:hypothetical protein
MYGYTFVRLRFVQASLSCWCIIAIYEVIAWKFTETQYGPVNLNEIAADVAEHFPSKAV